MKFSKAQQKIQIQEEEEEEEEEEKETVSIFRLIVLGVLVVRQYDPFLYTVFGTRERKKSHPFSATTRNYLNSDVSLVDVYQTNSHTLEKLLTCNFTCPFEGKNTKIKTLLFLFFFSLKAEGQQTHHSCCNMDRQTDVISETELGIDKIHSPSWN
uniref:Uncharacterized protein n=1 Tax=Daphnia galeata TaxID=27404 RepID=A0A8J2WJZ5_9CRUS|nr:unnamed protein product [Daphnia galeata]